MRRLVSALMLVLLAACGGGDGVSNEPPPPPTPPAAPGLSLTVALKELRFSWAAVSGATAYRLFENPDGAAGFSQVGADLTALSYNHPIGVHRRINASYRLDACNSVGCTPSAVVTPGSSLFAQAIGYVKGSSTGPADEFGFSVALSADGNTLAVGARFDDLGVTSSGAVYVFSRSAGTWSQQGYLKASNPGDGDQFGVSVALSADGNTLAVGASMEDSGTTGVNSTPNESAADSGAVYVFTRSAGAWSQQAYIKAANTGAGDQFGGAVALSADGNTLAVGAFLEDSNETLPPNESRADSGAAYVFTRSTGAWSQQAFLKASNPTVADNFGISVALSGDGDTLAVGAHQEDSSATGVNGTPDQLAQHSGAVYVFTRSSGVWSQQAFVKASNTGQFDNFGASVALSRDGNTLAVGAPGEDSNGTSVGGVENNNAIADSGAAYVFTRSGATWSQQASLKATNRGVDDRFGSALALSADGNVLAAGAPRENSSTAGVNPATSNEAALSAGVAYVFIRSAGVWSAQAFVKASNTGAGDHFGGAVALSDDGHTLAVGASAEDSSSTGVGSTPNESATDAGAVYLY